MLKFVQEIENKASFRSDKERQQVKEKQKIKKKNNSLKNYPMLTYETYKRQNNLAKK
jgi:hypothetical protein